MHAFLIALLLMPSAIVTRHDVADARYTNLGARFPAVVVIGRLGDATLISRRWLLTAAHVARALSTSSRIETITIGGKVFSPGRVILHPLWRGLGAHDIALIELTSPVNNVKPVAIYRGNAERSAIATIVGHGAHGIGNGKARTDDGNRRAATSAVDSVTRAWIYFSFDSPPEGTPLEGAPGPGDSGGPAIIMARGVPAVAGISSAGFDGRYGPGSYGAVDAFTRVSTHAAWIDSVMTGQSSPRHSPETHTLPGTPLGRRYRALIAAAEANTETAMTAFVHENFVKREYESRPALVPNLRRIAGMIRGSSIDTIISSTDTTLAVRFRTSSGFLTLELVGDAAPPHLLTDWRRYD
jgi:hypothetical protein